MNAEDLATTTMEPETRIIRKVTSTTLPRLTRSSAPMGSPVEPRSRVHRGSCPRVDNIDF